MLHFKKIIPFLFLINLVACAIPQPEQREVTKTVDVQLLMDNPKAPQAQSEELDSEISIPVAKKFQFNVCLKSSSPEVSIASTDVVILSMDSETKNLTLDKDFCVQWQESISMAQASSKDIEISRKLTIKDKDNKDKFKAPLEVRFAVNPFNNETKVLTNEEHLEKDTTPAVAAVEPYELGFESLSLKIEKKSSGQYSLSISGAPSLNGEVLRYGKVIGQIMINKKVLEARGLIRDGALNLVLNDSQFSCTSSEMVKIEMQLNAVTKKHSIKAFQESHDLKNCEALEGTYSL